MINPKPRCWPGSIPTGRKVSIFPLVCENKMRILRVRGVTQLELTQLVGHEVGFEPGPSEFREMERSCSEGVGGPGCSGA